MPWVHSDDPAIHFNVTVGHQYRFSETTNFIGTGGNFIANYLTDGQGFDYGAGGDWLCPTPGCYHGSWTKEFEAKSPDLYFSQSSACSSSTDCFTSNLSLVDMSSPANPALIPQTIWSLPATTDCSGQGGSGNGFDALCYNQNAVNGTVVWSHVNDPAILIDVIQGHTYKFTEQTAFTGEGGNFIANYLSDGQGYDYGLGGDWICPTESCYHGSWTKIFTANSNKLVFSQSSACLSSSNCFTTNLQLFDLSADDNPPSTPVTKVVFVPGFGASWNVDAFINCKNSGYSGGWTLAPYAKNVYQNFLTQMPLSGWNIIPFYYDWRQNVRDNSPKLKDKINSTIADSEKVDIVGHSMGGLVGRDYIETEEGGKASKLYMVGTPNRGSTLAYPLYANGEVWTDDLVEKIGSTLFIKHCEIPKSVQNVLPTYNYLRDYKTKLLIETYNMKAVNNYLPTSFASPFWNVKVGTLAGTAQLTLKIINIIKDPKWPDGRPVSKENVMEGDGTVLTESVQIPDASSNDVINQTHSGLIGTTEGINKILAFLGSPGVNDPPFVEPKSALILIGYPGTFTLTDHNGNILNSENGMIALINPVSEDYQLQITPSSSKTNFIVGQFLPNSQTLYKEYKFTDVIIEPKIIKFDPRHPKTNILHSPQEYEAPEFP